LASSPKPEDGGVETAEVVLGIIAITGISPQSRLPEQGLKSPKMILPNTIERTCDMFDGKVPISFHGRRAIRCSQWPSKF
jgi:hypothetical protein